MKKIILVVATEAEIKPFMDQAKDNPEIEFCITGVGMLATTLSLTRKILDLKSQNTEIIGILNVGIAGSFDSKIPLGEVVEIKKDTLSELGAENGDEFISIEELGYGVSTWNSRAENLIKTEFESTLKKKTSITVNSVHGEKKSIEKIIKRLNPSLESMEGAAVFYVSHQFDLPVRQIRSISNYVEPRNRDNWDIPKAIFNLNNWLSGYFYNKKSL